MITETKDLRTGRPIWPCLPHPPIPFSALEKDETADVVVIGAGVTGAMTAQALSAVGLNVVLLDRRAPLKGSTSATTALLQYELDKPLVELKKMIGIKNAARAWQRSKLALDALAAKIQSLDIDCDAHRVGSLYLSGNVLNAEGLAEEGRLRKSIGLYCDYLPKLILQADHGIERDAALMSFDNLSVNPLKLAAGFLLSAIGNGARIFAPVAVETVERRRGKFVVKAANGLGVTAKFLVYATGYEIPKVLRGKRFSLNSTYAIATKPQPDRLWPGKSLIWEASDPYLYLRTTEDGRVICGGEDEPFQNEDRRDALIASKTRRLEKKLKQLFPQLDPTADFAWAGSFGVTTTSLPVIGALPGIKNGYGIMAFGGNGITFSTIAADLVTTLITGGKDPDADLFGF
jgi:glycine/D-amino acid oxidase-like deaminating enzyme